ncbi:hypothetical protein SARC_13730, partial [Sphaeroforma arctica JP610]
HTSAGPTAADASKSSEPPGGSMPHTQPPELTTPSAETQDGEESTGPKADNSTAMEPDSAHLNVRTLSEHLGAGEDVGTISETSINLQDTPSDMCNSVDSVTATSPAESAPRERRSGR